MKPPTVPQPRRLCYAESVRALCIACLVALTPLAISGCKPNADADAHASGKADAGSVPGADRHIDDPVASAYLALQEKLAHDDIDDLDVLAANMVTALEGVAGEPGVDTMLAAAGRVGAKDIDTARLAFRKLSHGALEYMRAHPEAQKGLEVIHCPMTFKGEGAPWVQAAGPIMNPYEGSMMLHCGNPAGWDGTPKPR